MRFKTTTRTRAPTSVAAAQRWLERNPETEDNAWARVELLAWTGSLDEAYAVLDRLPDTTEAEHFERFALRVFLDVVAGREADVDGVAAAAEGVGEPGSDERLRAVTSAALAESRRRLARGEADWKGPLLRAQERIGKRSLGIFRADTWVRRFATIAILGMSFVALGWLFTLS